MNKIKSQYIRYDERSVVLTDAFKTIYKIFKKKCSPLVNILIKNQNDKDINLCMRFDGDDYFITPIFEKLKSYYNYNVKFIYYNYNTCEVTIILFN